MQSILSPSTYALVALVSVSAQLAAALPSASNIVHARLSAPKLQSVQCGNTLSDIPGSTFQDLNAGKGLYLSSCQDFESGKAHAKMITSGDSTVILEYTPTKGISSCDQSCELAYQSLGAHCVQNNDKKSMYNSGTIDFDCGRYSFNITKTKMWTQYIARLTPHLEPHLGSSILVSPPCEWVNAASEDDVCQAECRSTSNSQSEKDGNFCGQQLGDHLPSTFIIDPKGPCKLTDSASFYANVIDTANGNMIIGSCVNGGPPGSVCSNNGAEAEYKITCNLNLASWPYGY